MGCGRGARGDKIEFGTTAVLRQRTTECMCLRTTCRLTASLRKHGRRCRESMICQHSDPNLPVEECLCLSDPGLELFSERSKVEG